MSASAAPPELQTALPRGSKVWRLVRFVLLLAVLANLIYLIELHNGFFPRFYVRGYSVLKHFADPTATGPLLRYETHEVATEDVTIAMPVMPATSKYPEVVPPTGVLHARLYMPAGVAHPSGMVAVHGIHHLGMDEPRLVSFAKAVASSGVAVLTPQIDSLADYHVDRDSIGLIGESAVWLDRRLSNQKVIITGISFAGGLSLMAARDDHYSWHMRALVLMGAYDDLARVSRFLATGIQELPDGTKEPHPAHDYGAAVFVYAHLNQFFPAGDLAAAHDALREWLWEHPEEAKPFIEKLSPASQGIMDALLARRIDEVRPQILNAIHTDEVELAAISPHGHMDGLRVPVYILHGSADNIIPPAESLWLAKDLPRAELRDVLITGAFSHVDPEKDASLKEELRLVKFVGDVLRAAN